MIYKWYSCDLVTLHGERLETPSMLVKAYHWWSPGDVHNAMKEQLNRDGYGPHHRITNFRRVK